MPLTNKEKQAAFRERKAASNLAELRGIWATNSEIAKLKKIIIKALKLMRA